MATYDDKIAEAEEKAKAALKKVEQLKAQKEMAEARQLTLMIKGERASETRRKILIGAMILTSMEKDDGVKKSMLQRLDTYLSKDKDRALFDLPPVAAK